jgi:hypothetical protein
VVSSRHDRMDIMRQITFTPKTISALCGTAHRIVTDQTKPDGNPDSLDARLVPRIFRSRLHIRSKSCAQCTLPHRIVPRGCRYSLSSTPPITPSPPNMVGGFRPPGNLSGGFFFWRASVRPISTVRAMYASAQRIPEQKVIILVNRCKHAIRFFNPHEKVIS